MGSQCKALIRCFVLDACSELTGCFFLHKSSMYDFSFPATSVKRDAQTRQLHGDLLLSAVRGFHRLSGTPPLFLKPENQIQRS